MATEVPFIRPRRTSFKVRVDGAQGADLDIPITGSRYYYYTDITDPAWVADPEPDISRWFQSFAIQSSTTNGRNVDVQIKLIEGDEWVAPPTPYTSDETAAANPGRITPGDLFIMRLPTPGIMVRLLVSQPVGATDFNILVSMSENSDVALRT